MTPGPPPSVPAGGGSELASLQLAMRRRRRELARAGEGSQVKEQARAKAEEEEEVPLLLSARRDLSCKKGDVDTHSFGRGMRTRMRATLEQTAAAASAAQANLSSPGRGGRPEPGLGSSEEPECSLRLPPPLKPREQPWAHSHAPYPMRIPGEKGVGVWIPSGKVQEGPRVYPDQRLDEEEEEQQKQKGQLLPRKPGKRRKAPLPSSGLHPDPTKRNQDYVGRSVGFPRQERYGKQLLPV